MLFSRIQSEHTSTYKLAALKLWRKYVSDRLMLTPYKIAPILDPTSTTVFPCKSGSKNWNIYFSCVTDVECDMKAEMYN